nr:zinc finger, CCHC-type [Tanacetum cinerariifolium]
TKKKPNLNYLKVWGYRVVVRCPDPKLKTLGDRGIECIFVGYAKLSKAFRLYVIKPNESVSVNLMIESMDAIIDENKFSSVPRPSHKSLINGTKDIGSSVVPEKGFRQKLGIEYFDTYASVAHINTIRLLIALASIHNMIIHQMDVKTTILNGELDEEVYMNQPQGFIMPINENKVCKVIKSLYGLKQAPKQWHQKYDEVVLSSGYLLNQDDKCVYSRFDESGKGVIIFLYLMPNNIYSVSQLEYSRVIGCLMYAMTCTRPDISFAVGELIGYTDASWIKNTEENSSTSGWVFLLGGGEISWAFKKQTCITSSVMESKFVTLAAVGKEAEWLRNLILEIPLWSKPIAHISIRCDSATTLANAYSRMYNRKSRHLGVRHIMICKLIVNGVISIKFVRSQQNLVDHLKKGLARELVIKSAEAMSLKSNLVAEC